MDFAGAHPCSSSTIYRMKLFYFLAAICLLSTGCSSVNKTDANRHLKPVALAIEEYKERESIIPDSLETLQDSLPENKKLKLSHSSDVGQRWSIAYYPEENNEYIIRFHHVHFSASLSSKGKKTYSSNYFR